MILGWRSRGWLLFGFAALCVAAAVWVVLRSDVPDMTARWPSPERLDTLSAYTGQVSPMARIDDYGEHLPALPPIERPARIVDRGAEPPPVAPDWQLSAVLIAGNRPVAIIDDQQVRPGDRLDDGSVVEDIAPGRVVLRDPRGQRHVLRIAAGNVGF